MPDFPGLLSFFQHGQGREKNPSLTLSIPDLANRSAVGVFNRCRSRDSNDPVKLVSRRENHCRETCFFQEPRSLSDGLATERSGWRQKNCLYSLAFHLLRHGFDGFCQEIRAVPLKAIE